MRERSSIRGFTPLELGCHKQPETRSYRCVKASSSLTGFTLLELLVVMATISALMGIGVTFLFRFTRGVELQSEASKVVSLIYQTRDTAMATQWDAELVMSKPGDETILTIFSLSMAGSYPMEDLTGAYGRTFTAAGAEFVPGVVGNCLRFRNGAFADLGHDPRWGLTEGYKIECFIYVENTNIAVSQSVPLISADGILELSMTVISPSQIAYVFNGVPGSFMPVDYNTWHKVGIAVTSAGTFLWVDDFLVDVSNDGPVGGTVLDPLVLLEAGSSANVRFDQLQISRWGEVTSRALSKNVTVSQLEAALANASPLDDEIRIRYMPDGRCTSNTGQSYTLIHLSGTAGAKATTITIR